MISLQIKGWTSHLNMILSSALFFAEKKNIRINFICNTALDIPLNTCLLTLDGKTAFLDYNDGVQIYDVGLKYDKYFKRSLLEKDLSNKILPLGLHFNYSYKLNQLLFKKGFANKKNKIEIFRSWDFFRIATMSHFEMRVNNVFRNTPTTNDNKVIFFSRLWEPHNKLEEHKKQERIKINDTRINLVKALRKIPNTFSGIIADNYSKTICPDILIDAKEATKKEYFKVLNQSSIGIANEGLGGTPGWKIGEYVAMGKAVITNKIETIIPEFIEQNNYCLFSDTNEIKPLIERLRENNFYLEQMNNNIEYTRKNLFPLVYMENILSKF